MGMDWLNEMIAGDGSLDGDAGASLAQTDPAAWLRKQLEDDTDHCFTVTGENRYQAVSLKKNTLVSLEVELDGEGFVRVTTRSGVPVTEETELPFRMLQMFENATFKTMGYLPAKAGEEVTFQVIVRPFEGLDMGGVIGRSAFSLASQTPEFEKIRAGKPVREVCESLRGEHLAAALSLQRLLGRP